MRQGRVESGQSIMEEEGERAREGTSATAPVATTARHASSRAFENSLAFLTLQERPAV